MINDQIYWTFIYRLSHEKGAFKIYVSSHKNGLFHSAVLWYQTFGDWQKGNAEMDMKLEQFVDITEEGALKQCEEWVKKYLPGKYTIEIDERKG